MQGLAWILLFSLFAAPSVADTWKSKESSELRFVVKVDGSELPGVFNKFDVNLTTEQDGGLAGFEVRIQLTAADLGDPDTNAMLLSSAWFGTDAFPEAVFISSDIALQSSGAINVTGELDLKGAKKTVSFPVKFKHSGDEASISGSAIINRNDFNVGSGEWASDETVSATVEISFDVQLDHVR